MQKEAAEVIGMETEHRARLLRLWRVMANQLSRLFMRHNILVPELEKSLRHEAIEVALTAPEFSISGRDDSHKQTFSHAAVTTGLSRQEISAAAASDDEPVPMDGGSLHRLIRIMSAWCSDAGYQDTQGRPLDLPLRGLAPSFQKLCARYGRDTPVRPIADALVRNGNAKWTRSGRDGEKVLRFVSAAITSDALSGDDLLILTQFSNDFSHSLQRTLRIDDGLRPRFRQAYFNDIAAERIEDAREYLHEEMQKFNRHCAEGLEAFRAKAEGEDTIRIGVASFSFYGVPSFLERDEPGADE